MSLSNAEVQRLRDKYLDPYETKIQRQCDKIVDRVEKWVKSTYGPDFDRLEDLHFFNTARYGMSKNKYHYPSGEDIDFDKVPGVKKMIDKLDKTKDRFYQAKGIIAALINQETSRVWLKKNLPHYYKLL